ncbi:DUF1329 domain-containing protein [Pseudomonas sp. PDM19]|uniref:DUF1329 domain-containing protein n=1 Tax=Pseudomonas sp. PDM19 TaxID=2769272 RepID=UPI00177F7745|nr:DUF1329 domain-containing protein [Pseudomonas sp. PDM19]MBD9629982.1 DUF1329 domain-containing protein [Pseudomonas sp. PDM19]
MKTISMMRTGALALSLLASAVMAAVSPEEAAQLGGSLTPLGAEKAGNADGSIPAWTGGLKPDAAAVDSNGFVANPYAADKPLFVITAKNAEQYANKLSAGQLAMFKRYPDSYRIPVYATRRSGAAPQEIYDAAKQNALHAQTTNDGNSLSGLDQTHYFAFPIPKNGVEVLWNHWTRYRGGNLDRVIVQVSPQVNGSYIPVEIEEQIGYPWLMTDADKVKDSGVFYYAKQTVLSPSRMAGTVSLVHEPYDQVKDSRMAWVYSAGQRRVRRAPQIAYDGPGTAADGMRTADNSDMFNGAPDRYDWKLIGKKEMYIPYNNYELWSPKLKYDQIIQPGHINQDLTRYELHRVWEVEGTLKPGQRHIYAKRHMYFDEDTWTLVEVDHYDGRGQLWRVAEGYQALDYRTGASFYPVQTVYDLIAGRYSALGMINEAKRGITYGQTCNSNDFTPAALRNAGIR